MAVGELAVSNICWPDGPEAQRVAVETLVGNGVYAMDIAPAKAFPEMATVGPDGIDRDELIAFNRTLRINTSGDYPDVVRVAGMQAVTYGRTENMFSSDPDEVNSLVGHMNGIIRLAELVGARTIVYGSEPTRLMGDLSEGEALERASTFFSALNAQSEISNVRLGIEPVSTAWTKGLPVFGRTGAEVAEFVAGLHHDGYKNISFVPDSFSLADGGDQVDTLIARAATHGVLAPHAQIAEPGMLPVASNSPIAATHSEMDHALADAWRRRLPGQPIPTIAIEMFSQSPSSGPLSGLDNPAILAVAIRSARGFYGESLS